MADDMMTSAFTLSIASAVISDINAGYFGGMIYAAQASTVDITVSDSTISNYYLSAYSNSNSGGLFYLGASTSIKLTLANTLMSQS